MPTPTSQRCFFIALLATLATCARAENSTAAQTDATPIRLTPVVVTADLWATPLQSIPASVTVFDEQALRSQAITHFGDLVNQIPNLTWTGATSRPRYLQIRGIGENSQYEGETPDSSVRFLIDDLDVTGLGTIADAFDVHQVEVLRGPQAGAFGSNAAGGLVRLVTNAPTPFWTGHAEAGIGDFGWRTGGLAVGGPLIAGKPDSLMARFAINEAQSDGYRHNLTVGRDTNDRDELTARLRLTWNTSPVLRWDASVLRADFNNGFDEFALDNNGRYTYSDQPGRDEQRTTAASLRGTFTGIESVRLTSVTGVSRSRSIYSYDDDWTPASYEGFSNLGRDRTVWSEEFRADSTAQTQALGWIDRWTLGAYFADTKEKGRYTDTSPWGISGLDTRYSSANEALFAQIAHDFTRSTRLILGLRSERVSIDGRGTKTFTDFTTSDPAIVFRPSFSDTLFGGKITLEHDLTASEVVFASIARGYKAGGVNIDARISPPDDPLAYGTETLWNYEIGIRGNWFEHRLTGELTAFYLDRHNTQVRDSAGFGGSYRFFTSNGSGAYVAGLEASASYAITPEFSVRGSLAQMSSELDPFTLTNGFSGGDRRLANTPRYGYSVGARYGAATGLFADVELIGRAEQYDSNGNANELRHSFHLVNLNFGYTWRAWTFSLWAKNVFNERYEKRVFFFGNEDPDYVETRYEDRADPRQIGATVSYRF
jgi:outer membrane receptor protein involved in Fe transport